MNQTFQPQQQSISSLLAQVATTIQVSSTSLGLSRKDKTASALSDRNHNARAGVSSVNVSRLAGAEDRIKAIRQQVTAARECATANTTKWGDRELLANINIERFLRAWSPIKAEHDRLVKELEDDAPKLIEQARQNIGSFDVEPPEVEEIIGAFTLDFKMEAIPDASKFSSNIVNKQVEAELKRRFEADIAAAYQQAQTDALQRLAKPLENLVERMTAYDEREDLKARGFEAKGGYFRDSMVENVKQIAEVFGSFNLTGDPAIASLAAELDIFTRLDAQALRDSKPERDATAKKAKEILASLGDWIR